MFGWMHKAVSTGLVDRFDQASGGSRRLAFALPNYSLDACMNPFSPGFAFPGVSGSAAVGIIRSLAPHRLDRQGVISSSGSWAQSRLFT
jgi:hypothetical protein